MSSQDNLTSLAMRPKPKVALKLHKQDPSTTSVNKNEMDARGAAASVGLVTAVVMRPKIALKVGNSGGPDNGDKQKQTFGAFASALGHRRRSPSTSSSEGEASNSRAEKSDDEIPVVVKKAKGSGISGLRAIKRPRTLNPAYNSIPNEVLFSQISIKPKSALYSAALEGFTDAPHPAFAKDGKKTSNLASFQKIKMLVANYIHAEDGLTDRGKRNFKDLLTLDGYPSAETVRRLAKMYVRMVENGTGEDKRLQWFKGAFYRYSHLPAEMQGEVHESFVGAEREKMREVVDGFVYGEKEEGEILKSDEESTEEGEWKSGKGS